MFPLKEIFPPSIYTELVKRKWFYKPNSKSLGKVW